MVAECGELSAEVTGRLRFGARGRADFPAVGDWVAISARPAERAATIVAVLPRRSCLSRKIAGATTDEQILAANVDTVFLLVGLDNDFNIRRVERYLSALWESGATPVVLLNKADLCDDVERRLEEVALVAPGVKTLVVSAAMGTGLEQLDAHLRPGRTVVLLGSSGVGKSTLANVLMGEEVQATGGLRRGDGKGHHTTTSRELIMLPTGAMLIDTPGLRAIQLWSDEQALDETFEDIEQIVATCRFSNCGHTSEPGCQIRRALQAGELDHGRWHNYQKMLKELRHLESRQDHRARLDERRQHKQRSMFSRQHQRDKYGF